MYCRFISCIILIGCSSSPSWEKNPSREYPIWISDEFSETQKGHLQQAVQSWERSLEGYLSFNLTDNESVGVIHWHPSTTKELTGQKPLPENTIRMGWCHYRGIGSRLDIATDIDKDDFRWVGIHEMGHALGLGHGERNTVMCDRNSCSAKVITELDVRQFHSVWEK